MSKFDLSMIESLYGVDLSKFKLNEEEISMLQQIIEEMSKKGRSETLEALYYSDYDEIPVDIDTFLDDEYYLGKITDHGTLIYPYWRQKLKEMFAPDSKVCEVCLTGDTEVKMLDGTVKTMKELYKQFQKDHKVQYVYSFNFETNRIDVGVMTNAMYNGRRKVMRVTLDNGKSFKCTPDHKILMRDKHYKRAQDLKIGDSLMPFNGNIDALMETIKNYNHKVVSIEYLDEEEDVYDLTIDKHHNFGLNCGILVSNCITGAIGTGKSNTADLGIAYQIYKLMCLKDPVKYYRLTGGYISIVFFNVTLDKAYGVAYERLNKWMLTSPWFLAHGKVRGVRDQYYEPNKPIKFVIGSQESHGIGEDVFCLTGDTLVATDLGILSIQDLENMAVRVKSYDYINNRIVLSDNLPLVISRGLRDDIYEIELEDGSRFRCTSDHRLFLVDGTEIRADEIKAGDDLLSYR